MLTPASCICFCDDGALLYNTVMAKNSAFRFDIAVRSTKSKARSGSIQTPHGVIQTPAFVTVGTKGTVKSLTPADVERVGTQLIFGNTYHLVLSPGPDTIVRHGGIHALSGINKPFITDSGGFQVFSLARRPDVTNDPAPSGDGSSGDDRSSGGVFSDDDTSPAGDINPAHSKNQSWVKITDDGAILRSHIDGTRYNFTPEFSIEAQRKIGADLTVALDECIFYGASRAYTKKSVRRTHEWAERSLSAFKKIKPITNEQRLYGVIQGGMYDDIHTESAEFIAGLPFWGLAIGGVSVGMSTEEIINAVESAADVLGDDPRPRHLLGIGLFDQILLAVQQGVDTFDCVLPTRDARTGKIYIKTGKNAKTGLGTYERIDLTKSVYKHKIEPVSSETLGDVTYAYLHHLFRQKELLAYRHATVHNLMIMEEYFRDIRTAIQKGLL